MFWEYDHSHDKVERGEYDKKAEKRLLTVTKRIASYELRSDGETYMVYCIKKGVEQPLKHIAKRDVAVSYLYQQYHENA